MKINEKDFEAFMAAYWENGPTGRGMRKNLEAYEAAKAEQPVGLCLEWREGFPPHPWDKEWFIAVTTYGDRVVLKALPEEYTYDFKTADDTYIKKEKVAKWMQFPDSKYIAPVREMSELSSEIKPANEWQPMTNFDYEEGEILGWHSEYGTSKLVWCDESQAFHTDGGDYTPLNWVSKWMRLPTPHVEDGAPK